jgi:hypothetical protein
MNARGDIFSGTCKVVESLGIQQSAIQPGASVRDEEVAAQRSPSLSTDHAVTDEALSVVADPPG